jgi:hypothetical protein
MALPFGKVEIGLTHGAKGRRSNLAVILRLGFVPDISRAGSTGSFLFCLHRFKCKKRNRTGGEPVQFRLVVRAWRIPMRQ